MQKDYALGKQKWNCFAKKGSCTFQVTGPSTSKIPNSLSFRNQITQKKIINLSLIWQNSAIFISEFAQEQTHLQDPNTPQDPMSSQFFDFLQLNTQFVSY